MLVKQNSIFLCYLLYACAFARCANWLLILTVTVAHVFVAKLLQCKRAHTDGMTK
jgi:hypothetical protein